MSAKNLIGGKEKKPKRILTPEERKRWYMGGGGIALLVAGLIIWTETRPYTGPISVPICRTYAELRLLYPQTMRVTAVDYPASGGLAGGANRVVRLYYTYTGSFGETISKFIDCKFAADPVTGQMYIQEIDDDRVPVDQDKVDAFNRSIPTLLHNKSIKLDVTVPRPLPGDLNSLQMPYPY